MLKEIAPSPKTAPFYNYYLRAIEPLYAQRHGFPRGDHITSAWGGFPAQCRAPSSNPSVKAKNGSQPSFWSSGSKKFSDVFPLPPVGLGMGPRGGERGGASSRAAKSLPVSDIALELVDSTESA